MPDDTPTVTFGYGSNIWIDQMNRRCPDNKYIGVAVLREWRWMINQRGAANVVPSAGDSVYGFVYEISSEDEQSLDGYEGVPHYYEKKVLPLELITGSSDGETEKKTIYAMVYIDYTRTNPGLPATEYIHRLNMAIKDALQKSIPQSYVDKYLRPSVPIE